MEVRFIGMLSILFIGLKLTDNIDWSWWWVLAPLWVPPVVLVAIFFGIVAFYAISDQFTRK